MPTVDLTHPLDDSTPVYPGDPAVEITPHATHAADGYRVSQLALGSHAGTHVDAPAHTDPDGTTLDEIPVDRFRFRARRVDCRAVEPREAITREHLPAGDDLAPETDLLVLWTGFDRHAGTDRYRDHPYLAPAAAEWCARRALDVGVDAFSPDPTPPAEGERPESEPAGVPAHHALLGDGRVIVENLRGLEQVPLRFTLTAHPLALAGDGSPVRAVGSWREG